MREIDAFTIKSGQITGKELMYRAGIKIAEEILAYTKIYWPCYFKRFVFLAGKGNNGGDAYVAANYLFEKYNCNIIVLSISDADKLTEDARYYALKLNPLIKHEVNEKLHDSVFMEGDIIIDGLLGTGFTGEIKPPYRSWIETVNKQNKPVIAIDIPSGLNATTGKGFGIIADLTITVGLPKVGFFINDGVNATGKIITVDIGFPDEYIRQVKSRLELYDLARASSFINRTPCDIHKKSKGSVLVIGGSKYYKGAPILSALSALKSGAGLVTVAIPASSEISSGG